MQPVLFVGGDKGGRAGAEARRFARDRDLDHAGNDQEHFFAHVVVGRVWGGVGLQHGFVDFEIVAGVGAAFEDAAEGGSGVFVGVQLVKCANGGGQGFF